MEKVKAVMSWLLKSDGGSNSESQHQGFAPSGTAVSNTVSILVADINGPEGALATNRVKDILSRISGAMVKGAGRSLNISTSKTPIEGLLKAAEKGRDWLTRNQADILVWGQC